MMHPTFHQSSDQPAVNTRNDKLLHKNPINYLENNLLQPLTLVAHPEVLSCMSWEQAVRISVLGYCKDDPSNDLTGYDLSFSSNPKNLFLLGKKSFIETLSPIKILNPRLKLGRVVN